MKIIPVPTIFQYPTLPTGCESVAATMVLQYYGIPITAEEFAKDWLTCDANFYSSNDKLYGPNPHEVFAGNPFSKHSYGCFADPIVDAINNHSSECNAIKIANNSLDKLCTEYIEKDAPLLIWATMGMKVSKEGRSWYLEDDSKFTWTAGEHCLVLVGYNDNFYFLNDPQTGTTVFYPKELVKKRYAELGKQAVYIYLKK